MRGTLPSEYGWELSRVTLAKVSSLPSPRGTSIGRISKEPFVPLMTMDRRLTPLISEAQVLTKETPLGYR